jgi:hypothetical protein
MNTDELLRVWWRGCAIFSPNVAEVSSAHCCLILKPAVTLKAIIHFASRVAHCHRPAEVASCKIVLDFYQLHHMPQKWESPLRAMHEWFISDRLQDLFLTVECSKEARALVWLNAPFPSLQPCGSWRGGLPCRSFSVGLWWQQRRALPTPNLASGLPLPFFVPYRCSDRPRITCFQSEKLTRINDKQSSGLKYNVAGVPVLGSLIV